MYYLDIARERGIWGAFAEEMGMEGLHVFDRGVGEMLRVGIVHALCSGAVQ